MSGRVDAAGGVGERGEVVNGHSGCEVMSDANRPLPRLSAREREE